MLKRWTFVALIAALAATTFVSAHPPTPQERTDRSKAAKTSRALSIRGHVEGLYPGRAKTIHLRMRNRTSRPLVVRSVSAEAGRAAPGCSERNLKVRRKKGLHRHLAARTTRNFGLKVSMVPNAADACQGAKFKLSYRAKARRR